MNSNKIFGVLSALLGVVAVAFIVLTVGNFSGKKGAEQSYVEEINGGEFVTASQVDFDSAATQLKGLVSNDYEGTVFPEGMLEKFKAAYAVNNELVGWLSIPGTELDTAVTQCGDNNKYIKYDYYNQYTSDMTGYNYGNLFLDYRCINNGLSKNMVIFGHTTGRASGIPKQVYRSLYDYKDMNHFIKNPIIKYSTLYGEYTYKICAVFLSTTQRKDDNGYMFNYIYPDMSDENMVGYINQVRERMLYETGVTLEPTDKIITLSTCIYDYGASVDTRLVVVGRLLHEGETEAIDASLVKDNPDYRRPQVWYNRQGIVNPYKDSERWEPKA